MDWRDYQLTQTRRGFLRQSTAGLGTLALANLLRAEDSMAPRTPHFPAKAKNVIFLFQAGAPSQMDLFDPKPVLQKYHGQSLPPSLTENHELAFIKKNAQVLASERTFEKCGESGMEISDWLPHTKTIADDICLVRSMFSDAFNHQREPC